MGKKISVIISAYNAEKFLSFSIESIQSQTYDNWELIVVENGSTDTTNEICEKYLVDERIQLVHSDKV